MADMSVEVAEQELRRFLDAMDIVVNEEEWEEDKSIELLIRTLCTGRLSINEDCLPVYVPKMGNQDPITFYEPTGASYMAMDPRGKRAKKDDGERKIEAMFRTMADMTQTSVARFASMKNRDLRVCMAIATLFLAD